MAWTHVREAGTAVANNVSSTTLVFTVGASGCQVGDTLVAIIAADNSGTNGAAPTLSIADTSGNSWSVRNVSLRDPGAANEGTCCWIADCLVETALSSGNTITATFGTAVVAKAMSVREFAGGAQSTTAANRLAGQNGTNGTSTTPSATLNPATLPDYLMIGAVAAECGTADTFTQDSDITNGSWVSYTRAGAGTTTSGQTIAGAYKIVTANGSQTYNPTLGTSRDWAVKMVALRAGIDLAATSGNGAATTTADLTVTAGGTSHALEATSGNGSSTTTADLVVAKHLASIDGNGISTTTAALVLAVVLSAASGNGTSATTADLSAATEHTLAATSGNGTSTTTAALVLSLPLAATSGNGVAATTADLTVSGAPVAHALAGTSAGVGGTDADLHSERPEVHRAVLLPGRGQRHGRLVFLHPH